MQTRAAWAGFLAFDRRLADAARDGREPIMVQLRLAWWRDRLTEPPAARPKGEPLLALLSAWDAESPSLIAVIDGWEAWKVGEDGGAALALARVGAIEALARLSQLQPDDETRRAAAEWLGHASAGPAPRLPRALRPLALLRGLALRAPDEAPWRTALAAMRLGLLGR
ncbi:hypothetical protein [Novosphingobium sp. FKTRR1]|uniref:hypothetical protein n=1 Tax=Novosphingobium sp. FKTRR1 TaxID=2879118 RepID=UPI001CF06C16